MRLNESHFTDLANMTFKSQLPAVVLWIMALLESGVFSLLLLQVYTRWLPLSWLIFVVAAIEVRASRLPLHISCESFEPHIFVTRSPSLLRRRAFFQGWIGGFTLANALVRVADFSDEAEKAAKGKKEGLTEFSLGITAVADSVC